MKIPALRRAGGGFLCMTGMSYEKHPPQARNLWGIFFYPKIFHTFEAEEKTSN